MNSHVTVAPTPSRAATRTPEVSIGVPVFNGERYLARTLESLLAQSFADFELVISDNASSDGTRDICEDYARRDTRVRCIRQRANIGAPRNWNVVALEATGTFFKWSSASDISPPNTLERCVDVLRADPSVVLCYGRTRLIDESDQPLEHSGDIDIDVGEDLPSARFTRVCTDLTLNNAQCGVFRLSTLRRTRLDRPYPTGDLALMAELSLYGKFRLLPEILLLRRMSRDTFTSMLTPAEKQRVYDPNARQPTKAIRLRRHVDNMISIARAPIPVLEKLRATRSALRFIRWDRDVLCRELISLLR
jgi:glycosyltransferase involved in cell wall biosynthesis